MKKSKSNIKVYDHYEHLSISRIYDIEDDLCTARVAIYAMVSNGEVDITDSEVTFYLNGKACKYQGFKALYVSLFSEDEFKNYWVSVTRQAEFATLTHYANELTKKNKSK
tara:strand:- start:200 stop:529 length:330 start_codon:yes stop_codon:yes gene_type:complete